MKKVGYLFFTIFFLLPILSACSPLVAALKDESQETKTTSNMNSSVSVNVNNPQDVLTNMQKAMEQMQGYSWDVTANETIRDPLFNQTEQDYLRVKTEMIDPNTLHMVLETSDTESDTPQEIYLVNQEAYVKQFDEWYKLPLTKEQLNQVFSVDQTIQDPNYSYQVMKEQISTVQMHEETDSYILLLRTNDPQHVSKYGQQTLSDWLAHPDVMQSQISYSHFELELRVDKQTFQLKNAKQKVNTTLPFNDGTDIEVQITMETRLLGEVQKIEIPPEVKGNYYDDPSMEQQPSLDRQPYDPGEKI